MSLELHRSGSWVHPSDPGEPRIGKPRLSVTDLEAAILAELVAGLTVLEIGTGLGVSTRAMAETARVVHTVDIDPWVWENVWPDLPENVVPHRSIDTVPEFSVAFIDGDHSTEAVEADLASVAGCPLVIAHDTNSSMVRAGLGDGWRFIPTTHGLGVWRES